MMKKFIFLLVTFFTLNLSAQLRLDSILIYESGTLEETIRYLYSDGDLVLWEELGTVEIEYNDQGQWSRWTIEDETFWDFVYDGNEIDTIHITGDYYYYDDQFIDINYEDGKISFLGVAINYGGELDYELINTFEYENDLLTKVNYDVVDGDPFTAFDVIMEDDALLEIGFSEEDYSQKTVMYEGLYGVDSIKIFEMFEGMMDSRLLSIYDNEVAMNPDVIYPTDIYWMLFYVDAFEFSRLLMPFTSFGQTLESFEYNNYYGPDRYKEYYYTFTVNNKETSYSGNYISLTPNPATDVVNIVGENQHSDFSIISLEGQLLSGGKIQDNIVNIDFLPSGNYILQTVDWEGNKYISQFQKL